MVVKVSKPALNLREKLSELFKPSGIAGEAMLRADTPQEQFNLIGAGRRNMIINGGMNIAQRGNTFSGITSSMYSVDRWEWNHGSGTYNITQSSDGPPGFPTSFGINCTATGTTSAMQYFRQRLEGQDTYFLGYGTSEAKRTSVSFWVKSNMVGTFPAFLVQHSTTQRHFPMLYTINTADTWEYKSFQLSGDQLGNSFNNNTMEISVDFFLSGSNGGATATGGYWKARDTQEVVNNISKPINGATSRYWKVTGVQFEASEYPTPFEHRSYGEELALCQRYYEKSGTLYLTHYSDSSSQIANFPYRVIKRSTPTSSVVGANAGTVTGTGDLEANYLYNPSSQTANSAVLIADAEL